MSFQLLDSGQELGACPILLHRVAQQSAGVLGGSGREDTMHRLSVKGRGITFLAQLTQPGGC